MLLVFYRQLLFADAVTKAAIWFQDKCVLFLIDDVWPTSASPEGCLPELEGLLRGNKDSHIAISTRSLLISAYGGSCVDFAARDPRGPFSTAIFMAHAALDMKPSESRLKAMQGILDLCSGLPIALYVAGSTLSMHMKMRLGFEPACQVYLDEISNEMTVHPGVRFLENAIHLSLTALEVDFEKIGGHDSKEYYVRDLYDSLCVLKNQQAVPLSVLALMWNIPEAQTKNVSLSFSSISLAKISIQRRVQGNEECALHIYDLHLDYCRQNAVRNGNEQEWHRRLLNGHVAPNASLNETIDAFSVDGLLGLNLLEYSSRSCWNDDVVNKEYISKNLTRHLRSTGHVVELGATVLDLRWVSAQAREGEVLGVTTDFSILEAAVEARTVPSQTLEPSA